MHVLIICKNEEDKLKNKGAEWPQQIPHCKSFEIFQDTQWLFNPLSVVESGRCSNSVETL